MNPDTVRYTKEHEWIGLEGEIAVVGITDHAQSALGDITYVELPEVGTRLATGDVLGAVESVKAASDIFAPVDGTVIQVNESLADRPEQVNQQPFGEGWLCKLSGVRPAALDALMDARQYADYCAEEA